MGSVSCFTSFTFSYLGRALILAETLKAAHPNWKLYALMVDEPPPGVDVPAALSKFDHVVYARELGFERWKAWLFKHDIVEASTAVKGKMARHLLDKGYEYVVYLDPDIAVFHPLDSIIENMGNNSICLTPHQVAPNKTPGYVKDNELTSLLYGVYNLGFAAIKNDDVGNSFAQWWDERTYEACYDDVGNGVFTDQKWCDLVPALFPRVYIERDPGCNVASWNLSTRKISVSKAGTILVNGSLLKFYHFTKINSAGDAMTEKYACDNVEALEVWNWYKRALPIFGSTGIPSKYWAYGKFSNGAEITKACRILFRTRPDLYSLFDDPFDVNDSSFYRWSLEHVPHVLSDTSISGFLAI